eukprot:6184390-Pleurochrysis_carterae.AAC.1
MRKASALQQPILGRTAKTIIAYRYFVVQGAMLARCGVRGVSRTPLYSAERWSHSTYLACWQPAPTTRNTVKI